MLSPAALSLSPTAEIAARVPSLSGPKAGLASTRVEESFQEDSVLVAALVARTRGAAQRFIRRHDAFLRAVIRSSSPAAKPALDDLTQEVYVHLWRDEFLVLRQWRQQHSLRAFLRCVVRRLVWERLSRLRPVWEQLERDPLLAAAGLPEQITGRPPTPEEEAVANEMWHSVRAALNVLDAHHRQIIELRFYQDLSYREIADVLGLTPTNTGVRLNRALAHLKRAVRQRIEESDCSPLVELRSTRWPRSAVINSTVRPSCRFSTERNAA